jgi:hypothetical protein
VLIDLQSLWEKNTRLNKAQGSTDNIYTIVGAPSISVVEWAIISGSGSYVLTGTSVGTLATRLLPATGGVYTITGATVGLRATHLIVPASGIYTITGTPALFPTARLLGVAAGSYVLTGQTLNLSKTFMILAANGQYLIVDSGETQLSSTGQTPITPVLLSIMGMGR